jgi:hypothetical protein
MTYAELRDVVQGVRLKTRELNGRVPERMQEYLKLTRRSETARIALREDIDFSGAFEWATAVEYDYRGAWDDPVAGVHIDLGDRGCSVHISGKGSSAHATRSVLLGALREHGSRTRLLPLRLVFLLCWVFAGATLTLLAVGQPARGKGRNRWRRIALALAGLALLVPVVLYVYENGWGSGCLFVRERVPWYERYGPIVGAAGALAAAEELIRARRGRDGPFRHLRAAGLARPHPGRWGREGGAHGTSSGRDAG